VVIRRLSWIIQRETETETETAGTTIMCWAIVFRITFNTPCFYLYIFSFYVNTAQYVSLINQNISNLKINVDNVISFDYVIKC
jgi:hypothetical protein